MIEIKRSEDGTSGRFRWNDISKEAIVNAIDDLIEVINNHNDRIAKLEAMIEELKK